MIGLFCFVLAVLASPFKSKLRLEAENAVLRHQLIVLRRRLHGRVRLTNHDRWFFIQLYRWVPSILQVLTIVRPETLVRWHRAGFLSYWRWKSRPVGVRRDQASRDRSRARGSRSSGANPRQGTCWPTRRTGNDPELANARSVGSSKVWSAQELWRSHHFLRVGAVSLRAVN